MPALEKPWFAKTSAGYRTWAMGLMAWAALGLALQPVWGRPPAGFSLRAEVDPARAPAGTVVDLAIHVLPPTGWITYDLQQVPNGVMPTRIVLEAGNNLLPLGAFWAPPPRERPDPFYNHRVVRFFETAPSFRRRILIDPNTPLGLHRISGRVDLALSEEESGRTVIVSKHPFDAVLVVTAPPPSTTSRANAEHSAVSTNKPHPPAAPAPPTLAPPVTALEKPPMPGSSPPAPASPPTPDEMAGRPSQTPNNKLSSTPALPIPAPISIPSRSAGETSETIAPGEPAPRDLAKLAKTLESDAQSEGSTTVSKASASGENPTATAMGPAEIPVAARANPTPTENLRPLVIEPFRDLDERQPIVYWPLLVGSAVGLVTWLTCLFRGESKLAWWQWGFWTLLGVAGAIWSFVDAASRPETFLAVGLLALATGLGGLFSRSLVVSCGMGVICWGVESGLSGAAATGFTGYFLTLFFLRATLGPFPTRRRRGVLLPHLLLLAYAASAALALDALDGLPRWMGTRELLTIWTALALVQTLAMLFSSPQAGRLQFRSSWRTVFLLAWTVFTVSLASMALAVPPTLWLIRDAG